ncbi:MAG: hypothetical protein Q7S89_02535 [bacterium]|nr:hypothetical protein [bacterium]
MNKKLALIFAILGIFCGIVSLFFLPIVFGLLAIILGGAAVAEGAKAPGIIVIILALVFSVTGFLMSQFIPPT